MMACRLCRTSPVSLLCCFLLELPPSSLTCLLLLLLFASHTPAQGLWTCSLQSAQISVWHLISPSGLYSSGIFSNRLSLTARLQLQPLHLLYPPPFHSSLSAYHYLMCSITKLIVLFSVLFATHVSSMGQNNM